jgi:hypothetical protein
VNATARPEPVNQEHLADGSGRILPHPGPPTGFGADRAEGGRHVATSGGDLSPLLLVVIDALEAQQGRQRRREALALRAFGELARVQIPARGVFAPTENELYQAIDEIAIAHFRLRSATKALRARLASVEAFEARDEIASAANHAREVSDLAYFYAGLAFGITLADLR